MTELYINGFEIDLKEGAPIPLNYQLTDITETSKQRGNRSKTIVLPGTASNMEVFHVCFDVRVTDGVGGVVNFDPSKKAAARLYHNGLLQFEGVCNIKMGKKKGGLWEFEINMFSDFINYMDELKKIRLAELGWDDYLHDLDTANIEQTWGGDIEVNGVTTSNASGTSWDGIGYYYGLIDYGSRMDAKEWELQDMVPQVFVNDIVQRMFTQIGVTFSSNFFNTQRWRRLLLAWEGGVLPSIDATEADDTSVYTSQAVATLITLGLLQVSQNAFISSPYVAGAVTQDNSSQVQQQNPLLITTFADGIYKIEYNARVNAVFTPLFGFNNAVYRIRVYLDTVINGSSVGTPLILDQNTSPINGTSPVTVPITLTHELERQIDSQSQLNFSLIVNVSFVSSDDFLGALGLQSCQINILSGSTLNVIRDPMAHIAGQDVKIKYFMPKMTCADFFKGIQQMFNLYVLPDSLDATQVTIEPLINLYQGTANALNMTDKLDTSEIEVIPTPSIASRSYNWKFKASNDLNNLEYRNITLDDYGTRELPSDVDFAVGETNYQLPFTCIPIANIDDLILPRVVKRENTQDVRFKAAPFIVQLGNGAFPNQTAQRDGEWSLIENIGSPPYSQTDYVKQPYVGHLNDPDNPSGINTFDLVFKVPEFVFFPATAYPTRNLYTYHERFIKEIVDRFGKMLRARFRLNSADINELDFGVLWNVDGVIYRLQKIEDYDPSKDRTTKVELIKLIEGESIANGVVPVPGDSIIQTF
jgi:hypothetical protein